MTTASDAASATDNEVHPSGDDRFALVDKHLKRVRYEQDQLIEILHTAQDVFGYLSEDVLLYVARGLRLPPSQVYGVATFYHLFSLKPQGRHSCVICTGTACYIKGAGDLVDAIQQRFQVGLGETTSDDRISVLSARCLGACGLAPAAVVDGQVLGKQGTKGLLARLEELT